MTESSERISFLQKLTNDHLSVFFLIGLCCFIAFARYHTYNEPLEHDITTTMVIANELRLGRPYYSDVWENKPPALYISHIAAQSLFGYNRASLYALNLFMGIATLLGVYVAASSNGGGRIAGLWAAVFWALISGDMDLQANQPNTEAFMNPPLIWVLALFLVAKEGKRSLAWWQLLLIGSLLSLATFYKPHTALYGVFLGAAHVIWVPKDVAGARMRALLEVGVIAAVGLVAWTAFFGYFAYTGRFQMVYATMFIYPRYYSGNMLLNLASSFGRHLVPPQMHSAAPLIFLTALAAILLWTQKLKRPLMMLLGYALATQLTIGLPGRFYVHYYQLWLPLLAVGAGWSIVLLTKVVQENYRSWLPHAFAIIAALFMMQLEIWAYQMNPQEWSRRAYGGVYAAAEELGHEIKKILAPGETIYVLGDEPSFYFLTQTRPAVGVFFLHDTTSGPFAQQMTDRVLNALTAKPPDLVIILNSAIDDPNKPYQPGQLKRDHPIREWVSSHYCPVEINQREFFTICAKPGSALEARPSYRLLRFELLE